MIIILIIFETIAKRINLLGQLVTRFNRPVGRELDIYFGPIHQKSDKDGFFNI